MKYVKAIVAFLCMGLILSCSKSDKEDAQPNLPDPDYQIGTDFDVRTTALSETVDSVMVENLPADPATRDLKDGTLIGANNQYSFFRFSDGEMILSSEGEDRSDSASTKWDIGFNGTNIILNSGTHGLGQVKGQIVLETFDNLKEAPEDGYKMDEATGNVFFNWYNYNADNHVITSKPKYLLVIQTNDGKYVKMQIIDYYLGIPKNPSIETDQRYYTFRYVIQQEAGNPRF